MSTVAVVIPCFNHAHFVAGAVESAAVQSPPPTQIIVVDDGSSDHPEVALRAFPQALLIRQPNRGLAGARNTGLAAAQTDMVIFLDADDRLLPGAIESGLNCFAQRPDAAFVYGAYRNIGAGGTSEQFRPVSERIELIRCNWIGMIGAVMFDRLKLATAGGFDETLGMCEDWDLYLRLSRSFPFSHHRAIVAEYLRHDSNMSGNLRQLRHWIETVRQKEKQRGLDADEERAWHEGIKVLASVYPSPLRRVLRKLSRRTPY